MRVKGGGVIKFLVAESVRDESSEAAIARQATRELSPHDIRVFAVKNDQVSAVQNIFALFDEEAG